MNFCDQNAKSDESSFRIRRSFVFYFIIELLN